MSNKYIKSFDGLRGIGALMILLYHWPYKHFDISHGWEFMQMFFVMSGYLITAVLLEEKKHFEFKEYAGRFYLKRSLRLFPLYFGYLFVAFLFYIITKYSSITDFVIASDVVKHWLYLITYTFNWMNIVNFFNGWDYSTEIWSTHLWTLSMEEQFYLVFPFFAFYLSNNQLKKLAFFCIVGACIFRIVSFEWYKIIHPGDPSWAVQNLVRIPFAQMDSFAFGACIALFRLNFIKNAGKWLVIISAILISVYAINMLYVYYVQGENYYHITYGKKMAEAWMAHNYLFSYIITLVNLWCAVLLLYLSRQKTPNIILEWKPLTFIGSLSYGFYLIHLPILHLLYMIIKKFWSVDYVNNHIFLELVLLSVYISVNTFVAYILNRNFELKFIHLKNRLVKKVNT